MLDIDEYQSRIAEVCRELRVRRLDIVGSAARPDFSAKSDVDVLVNFEGDSGLFDRYFGLKEKLEAILGRSVDVIEERALSNPYVIRTIERDRKMVYGA
ncbi:MAG: nucleotidyltransferase domain-containing protein [Acidobacteria bacterium]|nr:nucleotidyltransferase domain-containing protein [Acidobacteriota bacterium]